MNRYWLILFPDNRFGPKNIGVTANSLAEAKSLVEISLSKIGWSHISEKSILDAEVIENIDIRDFDQNHVIPNMGVCVRKGVWFPNLNSHSTDF